MQFRTLFYRLPHFLNIQLVHALMLGMAWLTNMYQVDLGTQCSSQVLSVGQGNLS
jgi:hypothetical protein